MGFSLGLVWAQIKACSELELVNKREDDLRHEIRASAFN